MEDLAIRYGGYFADSTKSSRMRENQNESARYLVQDAISEGVWIMIHASVLAFLAWVVGDLTTGEVELDGFGDEACVVAWIAWLMCASYSMWRCWSSKCELVDKAHKFVLRLDRDIRFDDRDAFGWPGSRERPLKPPSDSPFRIDVMPAGSVSCECKEWARAEASEDVNLEFVGSGPVVMRVKMADGGKSVVWSVGHGR